jgi:hypothetical protein
VARAIYLRKSRTLRLDAGYDLLRQESASRQQKAPDDAGAFA